MPRGLPRGSLLSQSFNPVHAMQRKGEGFAGLENMEFAKMC